MSSPKPKSNPRKGWEAENPEGMLQSTHPPPPSSGGRPRKKRKRRTGDVKGNEGAAASPDGESEKIISRIEKAVRRVEIDPAVMETLAAANRDIDVLTLTELEHEAVRLEARLKAVKERMIHIVASGKRMRKRCTVADCLSFAQRGGLCIKHGPRRPPKLCSHEGCTRHVQRKGLCYQHGANYRMCKVEGCTKKDQQGGYCIRHGADIRKCNIEGCNKTVHKGGLCFSHRHRQSEEREECVVVPKKADEEREECVVVPKKADEEVAVEVAEAEEAKEKEEEDNAGIRFIQQQGW